MALAGRPKADGSDGELPPGFYWIDLFEHEGRNGPELFEAWRPGGVNVVTSETNADNDPPHTWVKFRVLGPVAATWPRSLATQIGFPTVIPAGADIDSASDTSTAQEAMDAIDEEADEGMTKSVGLALMVGGGLLLVGVLAALAYKAATTKEREAA